MLDKKIPARKASKTEQKTLTVTLPDLIVDDSDQEFRELISLLYAAVGRLQGMRRELAHKQSISSADLGVLMVVAQLGIRDGVRVSQIAEHLHIAAANVTATVSELERKDWLVKQEDPADRRAITVRLSERGRERFKSFVTNVREVNDIWFGGMSFEEMKSVKAFLNRVITQYDAASGIIKSLKIDSE